MADDFVIETRDLSKSFRGFMAVSGVNLRVRRGSIHALIGPNGAGKSTVFNLITKFLQPTSGTIIYNGRDITRAKPAQGCAPGHGSQLPDFVGLSTSERFAERARGLAAQEG